ncbi:Bbp16 family capsid cement protein [Celeribacter sp.]|uniref:Bbp16 family capsid cement protein n=1 Tax=Celeribacter sp. TaxID=1890673 RepID=UPI003A95A401
MIDAMGIFSDEQAVTASAKSTNSLDIGDYRGHGNEMYLVIAVTEDFNALTSLTVTLEDSADDSSFATVLSTAAIVEATLTAGYRFAIERIPFNCRRYLQIGYTVAGDNADAGKVDAYISPVIPEWYRDSQKVGYV